MLTNKKVLFLTGSTGLVGSYLLKVFLENDYKVYALARKKNNKSAYNRVIEILRFWDKNVLIKSHANLEVLEGDLIGKNFGLDKKNIHRLINEVDEIFHCAAATKFNSSLTDLRKVNVDGTREIFDFAFKWPKSKKLKKINLLSTTYICGDHRGIFNEDDLDVGQKFNTFYEKSKFEAEKLANNYRKKGLWIDIFRPSMVVGESKTGKTMFFQQAFYQALKIWNSEIFDFFPTVKKYFFNMVFVDELCKSIFHISRDTCIRNKNYHPFNSNSPSLEKILSLTTDFFGLKKVKFVSFDEFIKNKSTPIQRKLVQYNFLFLNNKVKLLSNNTSKILKKNSFKFSFFTDLNFLKLLEYAESKGFLIKKKNN